MIYNIHLCNLLFYLSWHLIGFISNMKHAYLTSKMDKMENHKLQNLAAVIMQPVAQYKPQYKPLTMATVAEGS